MRLRAAWGLAMALGIGACGGSDGGPPPVYSLVRVSGDSQNVAVTTASAPLVARVVDADDQPVAGITVNFAVTAGTGDVTTSDISDVDGLVSGLHVPGESHYDLLRAFASAARLQRALALATERGLSSHELGDACMILPR